MDKKLKDLSAKIGECIVQVESLDSSELTKLTFEQRGEFSAELTMAHSRLNEAKKRLDNNIALIAPKQEMAAAE